MSEFINTQNFYGNQFVLNISKFQFQIYKTNRFTVRILINRYAWTLVLGKFGIRFHFRGEGKDWLGRYPFDRKGGSDE